MQQAVNVSRETACCNKHFIEPINLAVYGYFRVESNNESGTSVCAEDCGGAQSGAAQRRYNGCATGLHPLMESRACRVVQACVFIFRLASVCCPTLPEIMPKQEFRLLLGSHAAAEL